MISSMIAHRRAAPLHAALRKWFHSRKWHHYRRLLPLPRAAAINFNPAVSPASLLYSRVRVGGPAIQRPIGADQQMPPIAPFANTTIGAPNLARPWRAPGRP